jgi:hypothetical protein
MLRKSIIVVVLVCMFMLLAMFSLAQYNIYKDAEIKIVSLSGDYRIEYVTVELPYTYKRYAYVRFIELINPGKVYRSPIALADVIDLESFETKGEVGVVWLMFDKEKHKFRMGFPQWRESWLNLFISNTPYSAPSNG